MGFARSSPLAGAVFLVFPCPSLIVFSLFSLPSGAAFPRFLCFPFVPLIHSVRLRSFVACRGAVRYCFPSVPVSSPVSVFDAWGWEAVSAPWCWCSFRGVALRVLAWCPVVPLGGSFPVGTLGGAFWLVFSYGIIGRVVRGGMGDLFASGRA